MYTLIRHTPRNGENYKVVVLGAGSACPGLGCSILMIIGGVGKSAITIRFIMVVAVRRVNRK